MTLIPLTALLPRRFQPMPTSPCLTGGSLAATAKGGLTTIRGFAAALSAEQRTHLQAYGLLPGVTVRVMQQRPVTVIQLDQLEVALDSVLAAGVLVQDQP
jgi:Fe2+ transport system protein FeoA